MAHSPLPLTKQGDADVVIRLAEGGVDALSLPEVLCCFIPLLVPPLQYAAVQLHLCTAPADLAQRAQRAGQAQRGRIVGEVS